MKLWRSAGLCALGLALASSFSGSVEAVRAFAFAAMIALGYAWARERKE